MNTVRRQFLFSFVAVADLCCLSGALYLAIRGRAAVMPLSMFADLRIQVHTVLALLVIWLSWKIAFTAMGLYRSRRMEPMVGRLIGLLLVAVVATLITGIAAALFRLPAITGLVLVRFFTLALIVFFLSRFTAWQILRLLRLHGRNLRHLVIVGTNARAVEFAVTLQSRPDWGYKMTGFVDDIWCGPRPAQLHSLDLVSSLAGFRSYLRDHIVDEVVIALPVKSFYDEVDDLIRTCREHGVIVRVLTSFFDPATFRSRVDELGSAPVVTFASVPIDSVLLSVKRLVDIGVSGAVLLLLSPVMLVAYACIKLDSRGPAIFMQERIGLNKRRFRIFKFRTMVLQAEALQGELEGRNEAQGPVFKIKGDPRITRVGRILRKTSIDELPQLLNVLKGDMSLVGPRPLPVRDYRGFSEDWQRRRFSVRPGITCLWQVSGRSSISFEQWMRLDMEYIDRWSIWLDIQILARTIPAVVRGTGAA